MCLSGHDFCVEPLLDFGGSFFNGRTKDQHGFTVLHCAALSGSIDIISLLDSHFRQFSKVDPKGELKSEIYEMLTDSDNAGKTPLQIAAENGHVDMVNRLIKLCPKAINLHDKNGLTPFTSAIVKGHVKVTILIRTKQTK